MIKKTNKRTAKLIVPVIPQYNENEKKNESLISDSKMSVKPIIRPKPLNLKLITESNNKSKNRKEDFSQPHIDYLWKAYNQKIIQNNSFSNHQTTHSITKELKTPNGSSIFTPMKNNFCPSHENYCRYNNNYIYYQKIYKFHNNNIPSNYFNDFHRRFFEDYNKINIQTENENIPTPKKK